MNFLYNGFIRILIVGDTMNLIKLMGILTFSLVLFACEDTKPKISEVNQPNPVTLTQFDAPDYSLDTDVSVTLDDGTTLTISVDWETSLDAFDTSEHGTFEIEGTLVGEEFTNPGNLKAVQRITIQPGSLNDALAHTTRSPSFKTMFEAFEHPDKARVSTLFIPSEAAIDEVLKFLEMDLETFMNQDFFEPLMLDHMSGESISKNRLETNVPALYENLRNKELIVVEGSQGSPLIDSEHSILKSIDLDAHHIHFIDGLILSEDTLSIASSNLFDDAMGERLLEILREQGLVGDLLFGSKFTIFMPDQAAFVSYAQEENLSLSDLLESSEFETLILGHMIKGEYKSDTLYTDAPQTLEAITGESIEITVDDGYLYANHSQITANESIDQLGTMLTIDEVLSFEDE